MDQEANVHLEREIFRFPAQLLTKATCHYDYSPPALPKEVSTHSSVPFLACSKHQFWVLRLSIASLNQCLSCVYYTQVPCKAIPEEHLLSPLISNHHLSSWSSLGLNSLLWPKAVWTSHNTAHLPQPWCDLQCWQLILHSIGWDSQDNKRSITAGPWPTAPHIFCNNSWCSNSQCRLMGISSRPCRASWIHLTPSISLPTLWGWWK